MLVKEFNGLSLLHDLSSTVLRPFRAILILWIGWDSLGLLREERESEGRQKVLNLLYYSQVNPLPNYAEEALQNLLVKAVTSVCDGKNFPHQGHFLTLVRSLQQYSFSLSS